MWTKYSIVLTILITLSQGQFYRFGNNYNYEEPQTCQLYDGRDGKCVRFTFCDEALWLLGHRRFYFLNEFQKMICGMRMGIAYVCCSDTLRMRGHRRRFGQVPYTAEPPSFDGPTTEGPTPPVVDQPTESTVVIVPTLTVPVQVTTSTQIPPVSPVNLNEVCGSSEYFARRIVGGSPAKLKWWPWMAALFIDDNGYKPNNNRPSCGGSLISQDFVITAAHCLMDSNNAGNRPPSAFTVRLGELDYLSPTDGAQPIDVPVGEVIMHEKFNPESYENDIALLRLQTPVFPFTDSIKPICIPDISIRSRNLDGSTPMVAGWGTIAYEGNYSSILRQVQITIVSNDDCNKAFKSFGTTIVPTNICAGNGLKDSCQGDSGGPLMLINTTSSRYNLIGIVSSGYMCAEPGIPGIYTRVSEYVDWIKQKIQ